jgi:hypothetical protein
MTEDDKRLEAALTRLTDALDSLEVASRRILDSEDVQRAAAPNLASALEHAEMKAAKLEAASAEVSRVLAVATEAIAAIVSKQAEPTGT